MTEKSTTKMQQESCENHNNGKENKKSQKRNRPRLFSRDVTPLIFPKKESEVRYSNSLTQQTHLDIEQQYKIKVGLH